MMLYLRRVFGYALTGDTREQALFFMYGTGANGKSVIIETISGIMGDYHRAAPIETFTASKNDRHPTELAVLHGARLVTSTETEQGRRWAESRIKTLTGGDVVPARFMKQDFFYFRPKFKLVIAGNHKPGLRTVDEAIRRRMNLIPFAVTVPLAERDDKLAVKLRAEWSGILKWLLAGCLEWQQMGICQPNEVKDATSEYLKSEDAMAAWLKECCDDSPYAETGSRKLYTSWKDWATLAGEYVGSEKTFSQSLSDRGYEKKSTSQANVFKGLMIKPVEPTRRDYGADR
jgi:putative DNA primase/helicase